MKANRKIKIIAALSALMLAALIALGGCSLFDTPATDSRFPSEVASGQDYLSRLPRHAHDRLPQNV